MDSDQARELVLDVVKRIAPEADLGAVDPDGGLRAQFDLDSMDFLDLVEQLSRRSGVPIVEDDYAQLDTLVLASRFLADRAGPE